MSRYAVIENLALSLLEREGIAVIWLLHVTAAQAYSVGHSLAAQILIDTADAAEQMWRERIGRPDSAPLYGASNIGNCPSVPGSQS